MCAHRLINEPTIIRGSYLFKRSRWNSPILYQPHGDLSSEFPWATSARLIPPVNHSLRKRDCGGEVVWLQAHVHRVLITLYADATDLYFFDVFSTLHRQKRWRRRRGNWGRSLGRGRRRHGNLFIDVCCRNPLRKRNIFVHSPETKRN